MRSKTPRFANSDEQRLAENIMRASKIHFPRYAKSMIFQWNSQCRGFVIPREIFPIRRKIIDILDVLFEIMSPRVLSWLSPKFWRNMRRMHLTFILKRLCCWKKFFLSSKLIWQPVRSWLWVHELIILNSHLVLISLWWFDLSPTMIWKCNYKSGETSSRGSFGLVPPVD